MHVVVLHYQMKNPQRHAGGVIRDFRGVRWWARALVDQASPFRTGGVISQVWPSSVR